MQLLKTGLAVLMFGVSVFIFSSGWQAGQTSNWAGQSCYYGLCSRPEWIGLGAAGILTSLISLTLNLKSIWNTTTTAEPPVRPKARVRKGLRINSTSVVFFGLAAASAGGVALTNYGISV